MQHRTCPTCGNQFESTSYNQVYCPPTPEDRARRKGQAVSRCAKRASNKAQRAALPERECNQCGVSYKPRNEKHVYCTDACHKLAKGERYRGPDFGPQFPPSLKPRDIGRYRKALAQDPCAYCGNESTGIDHIEPRDQHPDRKDWTNWTGACKGCNGRKTTLPLLSALLWVHVCREYHSTRKLLFTPSET